MSETTLLDAPQQAGFGVVKFNVADAAIAEMREKYLPLKIVGVNDKAGYKAVHDARMIVRAARIGVDKTRKDLNADAQDYVKKVNAEAKRLTAELEPIESDLEAKEKAIDDEKERIKREAEEAKQRKLQARVDALRSVNYVPASLLLLGAMADDEFDAHLAQVTMLHQAEQKRLAEEAAERQRQEEAEAARRREAEAAEREARRAEQARLDAERAELDRRAAEQRAEADRLQAEADRLAEDRRKAEAEQRAEEVRLAAERRKLETAQWELDEAARREADAKAQAERDAASKPTACVNTALRQPAAFVPAPVLTASDHHAVPTPESVLANNLLVKLADLIAEIEQWAVQAHTARKPQKYEAYSICADRLRLILDDEQHRA